MSLNSTPNAEQIQTGFLEYAECRKNQIDECFDRIELDWKPNMDFAQGLQYTIQWYAAYQDWMQKMIQQNG